MRPKEHDLLYWFLLSVLTSRLSQAAGAPLQVVSWSQPICANSKCTTSVQLSLSLENGETLFNTTFSAFTLGLNSVIYKLTSPINIVVSMNKPLNAVTLTYLDTLYNAYEGYAEDPECHVSKTGPCYDPSTQPTSVPDGSERYVLCCMGHAVRGNGQHCLRYDYSSPYQVYRVYSQGFAGTVTVAFNGQGQQTSVVLSEGNYVQQAQSLRAFMNCCGRPLESTALLLHAGNASTAKDWRTWFWSSALPPFAGISADVWKARVRCHQPMHSDTQPDVTWNQSDQFVQLRKQTLDLIYRVPGVRWEGFGFVSETTRAMMLLPGVEVNLDVEVQNIQVAP